MERSVKKDIELENSSGSDFRSTGINLRRSTDKMNIKSDENLPSQTEGDDMEHTNQTVKLWKWRFNKVIAVTHVNIFLYATCFWIQNGTLPYLSKKLNVDPVQFGYLQTTFAIVQLAGGPLFGRFGDMFGGRAAMTLAFLAASASYFLLGMSTSIPLLFISRLPSMFMHAMQGGQMIVTDIGETSQRADALGKLGLSYGVGMVVGPLIGGILTKVMGEEFTAFVACAGSLLSVGLVLTMVPQHTKKPEIRKEHDASTSSIFNMKKIISLIMAPGALFLLSVRLTSGIPIGVFQSMFSVVALNTFKLPADQNGYLMSYIGITSMIVQGVGIGLVTKRFEENAILKWSTFILVWAYLMLSYVTSVFELCAVCLPLIVGLTTQNIIVSSSLTRTVADADTGAMLGLNMAVNSLVRSVSPTIGGYMLEKVGFPSFGYLGFIINGFVTAVLFWKFRSTSSPK